MIKSIWLYLERWFPKLVISRANKFSYHLELDTGFRLITKEGEDGLMFFLLEPGQTEPDTWQDSWSSLDDAIFDLGDFERSNCLEHLPS